MKRILLLILPFLTLATPELDILRDIILIKTIKIHHELGNEKSLQTPNPEKLETKIISMMQHNHKIKKAFDVCEPESNMPPIMKSSLKTLLAKTAHAITLLYVHQINMLNNPKNADIMEITEIEQIVEVNQCLNTIILFKKKDPQIEHMKDFSQSENCFCLFSY